MDIRQRLIEEAAQMFRTYGIRAVTMDMLASQMGISKRTIYEVFSDKDELLQGVMIWMAMKKSELTKNCLESSQNVIEAIFMIMDNMMEHFRKMSPSFRLDMKKYHQSMMLRLREKDELPYDNSKDILIRGIREGIFRPDIDIELTDRCLKGVTKMSNEKETIPEDFENEELIRDFFINYLRGISTQKGLDLISQYDKKRNSPGSNRIN